MSLTCSENDPNVVTYKGRIIATNERNTSGLKDAFDDWVLTGPILLVSGEQLKVAGSVSSDAVPDDDSNGLYGPVSGVIAGTLTVFLVIVLIVSTCVCCCRRYKK